MKKDDLYRSQFRMPYDLYEQLKAAAESNKNSVNAELVARLQESFSDKRAAEGRMTALEIKSLMSEFTLSVTLLSLLQQVPKSEESEFLSEQLEQRLAAMGDIEARMAELIGKLPVKKGD